VTTWCAACATYLLDAVLRLPDDTDDCRPLRDDPEERHGHYVPVEVLLDRLLASAEHA
jgi:hypothetical protein